MVLHYIPIFFVIAPLTIILYLYTHEYITYDINKS